MTTLAHYRLLGSLGSPYSMKVRAILRYRRLPHVWIQLRPEHEAERRAVKAPVIPVMQYLDGGYRNDSTPMAQDLERLHPDHRRLTPEDPADAFLALLLEDMADEWGTKIMFHYRWFAERDQRQLSRWLSFDRQEGLEEILAFAEAFRARQTGRMALVGCTPANAPVIEESARRILAIFEGAVTSHPYFFGGRPSVADFAWYGQFSQLIVDPTPHDLMLEMAPFTARWVMTIDDASGVEGVWRVGDRSPAVEPLLAFAGEVYFPFLEANAAAVDRGEETFTASLLGRSWTQSAFKYQAKCLQTLRGLYATLGHEVRRELEPLLRRTGCLHPLSG